MGSHRRRTQWPDAHSGGHGDPRGPEGYAPAGPGGAPPRRAGGIAWVLALAGVAIWSVLAWLAYGAADAIVTWAAANAGVAVAGGRGLAEAAGVGREVGAALDATGLAGLLAQAATLLGWLLKPAIALAWFAGAVALLLAPLLLGRLARRYRGGYRH